MDETTLSDAWEEIWDVYLLGKAGLENELELYRKWIPIFDKKLSEYIEQHNKGEIG